MVDADYLREVTSEDPPVYLPVHDIGTLRLSDMLSRVRAAGEDRFLNNEQLPEIGKVDRLVAAIQDSYLNVLGEQTLKDLVLARDAAPLAEISSQPRPASMEQ
jgi:hypothetical protein